MGLVKAIILTGTVFYLITCAAILDIARKDFGAFEKKILWLVITMIPFIGCIVYFVFGYRKGKRPKEVNP